MLKCFIERADLEQLDVFRFWVGCGKFQVNNVHSNLMEMLGLQK